jgi:zinc protease
MSAILALVLLPLLQIPAQAIEVAFEQDANLPLVYINVAVKAGAVNDPPGQSGLTNFMGEMLLRGTKSRTKEQIDLELDQMGARLEVEVRAEALILRGAVISSQLDPFLNLLSEIVTQPKFPEREARKLRAQIHSGILEELGHDKTLASRRFNKYLFNGHPYGNPVLGTIKDIEKLSVPQMAAQYDKLFRDKRLLVVGTGDAAPERILAWAETLSRARPGGDEATPVSAPSEVKGRRLRIIDKPGRTQTQIMGGQLGVLLTDKDFFPLYMANHVFGGGSFQARMMVEIRVKRGWAYGAYSSFRHGRQPRLWMFYTFPTNKDTPGALALTLQMSEEFKKNGITADEFQFAHDSLINGAGFMFNTPKKRVENKLLERTLGLPDGFMKSYGPEMAKLTRADLNTAVGRFLRPENFSILVLGTAKDLKAPLAQAAGVPLEAVEVVPYTQE